MILQPRQEFFGDKELNPERCYAPTFTFDSIAQIIKFYSGPPVKRDNELTDAMTSVLGEVEYICRLGTYNLGTWKHS